MPDQIDPRWAWQRYRPTEQNPWDLKKAGHLFRRTTFGATRQELQSALRDGPDRTISRLMRGDTESPAHQQLQDTSALLKQSIIESNDGGQLSAWWLFRMLYTGHPLREKMTLFWHNHFATSNAKVNNTSYMIGQYELIYRRALGNFGTLLQEMSHDPAMMVWLDTDQSPRNQPNENYARELMELFSLGINHPRRANTPNYTEEDIREAARAFTGWRIRDGRAVFRENLHDPGEKNVMGQRGRWRSRDIVRICLEQEACPYFIAGKLFRFLISETIEPTAALLEPLATEFRRNYDFGALVERMIRSNLFFAPQAYRSIVKWPVDFALNIIRGLEGRVGSTALSTAMERLGQRLFYPPNVAGWEAGRSWLNAQTFLFRQNLALALTSTTDNQFGRRTDPARLVRNNNLRTDEQIVDFFSELFLQGDVSDDARRRLLQYARESRNEPTPVYWTERDAVDQRVRTLCQLTLRMPEFQLS